MKAREFKLYNNNGDMIDFLDNLDFFGVNPEGLGAQFDNSFKRSGVNFLKDESELTGGVFKISLIFGMQTGNPYNRYAEFIELLNKPPYRLVYGTSAGTYSRQCVLNEITKTEIKSGDVLLEDFSLDFTTPWYNEIAEEIDPVEDKDGDGKIYSLQKYKSQTPELPRRIKWWGPPESDLSAVVKFTDVPKNGYQAGDIWYWTSAQEWDGRNLINNDTMPFDNYGESIIDIKYTNGIRTVNTSGGVTYLKVVSQLVSISSRKGKFSASWDIENLSDLTMVTHNNHQTIVVAPKEKKRAIFAVADVQTSNLQFRLQTNAVDQKLSVNISDVYVYEHMGTTHNVFQRNPSEMFNGANSGYFMATKSNSTFDFNDWVPAPFDPNNYADIKKGDIWLYDPEEYTLTENYTDVPRNYRKGEIWHWKDGQTWDGMNLFSWRKLISNGYIDPLGTVQLYDHTTTDETYAIVKVYRESPPNNATDWLHVFAGSKPLTPSSLNNGLSLQTPPKPGCHDSRLIDVRTNKQVVVGIRTRIMNDYFDRLISGNLQVGLFNGSVAPSKFADNPFDLFNKSSGYFISTKDNSDFDFNDWVPYNEYDNRDTVHYAIAKRDATKLDVKDWAPYSGPIIHDDVPSIYRKGDIWMYDDSQLWWGKNLWSRKKAVKGYIKADGSIAPPDAKNLTSHKIPISQYMLDKPIYINYGVYVDMPSMPQLWTGSGRYDENDKLVSPRIDYLESETTPMPRWELGNRTTEYFNNSDMRYWRWSARYLDSPHAEVYLSWGVEDKQISMYDTYGQSAMMVAKFSSSDYFAFDDWEFYDQTSLTDASMFAYIYDYIYEGDTLGIPNSFVIRNDSRHLGQADGSPIEITVHGPVTNPRWEVIVGSKVVQTDGFNLSVPAGHRLVVSSVPGNQYAKIISKDGLESNVYQYQHLNMTNFVTIPGGTSTLVFYNCKRVNFKYREERVIV